MIRPTFAERSSHNKLSFKLIERADYDDYDDDEEVIRRVTEKGDEEKKGITKSLCLFQKRHYQCYKGYLCQNFTILSQFTSLLIYIIFWVANGELLQGIANGKFCPGHLPYDKPATLTWFSYNYMILSAIFVVYPYVLFQRKREGDQRMTLSNYAIVWAGKLGLKNAVLFCTIISYNLLVLNFLYIAGLECISVSLSNAIYQLQTPFTISLSVCVLKDNFVPSEALGIIFSLGGVALIVLPPFALTTNNEVRDSNDTYKQCSFFQQEEWFSPALIGVLATLGSTAIGSLYLVSWRIFSEKRSREQNYTSAISIAGNDSLTPTSRLEGFVDTHMTLAMIGFCNLLLGWPCLFLMHWLGLESLEMPPVAGIALKDSSYYYHWGVLLNANGLVEYAFDASCAVAIYMTSPIATSIIAPLSIPLAMAVDYSLYGVERADSSTSSKTDSALMAIGVVVILVGIVLLEVKPNLPTNKLLR